MAQNISPPLEDVLERFVAEIDDPAPNEVLAFAARFPEHRTAIIDFAATWASDALLPPPRRDAAAEQRLATHMRSFVENALFALKADADMPSLAAARASGTSLAALATAGGKSLHDVARAAGLDLGLMRKLNARAIKPDTIPQRLSRRIAGFIGAGMDQVLAVWTGPPAPAPQPSFFAVPKPPAPVLEDFAAAVAASTLSPEAQAILLSED